MKLPKPVLYVLRVSITVAAMWLAFRTVPMHGVLPLLTSIPWHCLFFALVLTHAGQITGAMRTRLYLHFEGIDLPALPSLKLHYIGGLFNAFLPGGAGGDAYKAWWLKRHRQGRLVNMVKLMIAGRLNGLWALGVLLCSLALGSALIRASWPHADLWIMSAIVLGTIGYYCFARYVLKETLFQQVLVALYSMALQCMLIGAAFILCDGIGIEVHALEYVTLFMLSCILAMLPISIGGIGVRELALLHGSAMLGLSEPTGVTLAFTFTLLTLTIPLVGAFIHHFYPPEKGQ